MSKNYKGLSPHNDAQQGDFAKTVLMPGDPLRAKFIAENFLENAKCVNEVRGMLAYTGMYKGTKVSVMGHGMGIPSIGIYSYELFAKYGVDNIIRVGSCAGISEKVKLLDIIIADEAYSDSIYGYNMLGTRENILPATKSLVKLAEKIASKLNIYYIKGMCYSSDNFYRKAKNGFADKIRQEKGVIAIEMEAFGLFANAIALNKKALTILTCSDHSITKEVTDAEERRTKFTYMMKLALEMAIELDKNNYD